MSKTLMAIIVLAVVVILGFWLMGPSAEAPGDTADTEADTTAAISQELDSVNLGDLDKELQDVTAELNNL